jgi:hypothetical protein
LNSQSHVITKQLHQLWKVAAWLISTNCFWCHACVHMMKQPLLWRVAFCSWPMIHRRWCVVNPLLIGIYCHLLNGNQLVQLSNCLWYRGVNVLKIEID